MHELIRRILTDDVLRETHGPVYRAEKRDGDDESGCSERISKVVRRFRHVLRKEELVNFYIHGLTTEVREMVAHKVGQM